MSFTPNIIVFGVGGAGSNAVNNMVEKKLQGVKFVVANTDMQSLMYSKGDMKMQLGATLTQGLGAGGKPEVGREAARENIVEIKETLKDCNMLFIAAGMGGGTGTGAAPLIAKIAREMGVLTIGIVTKPFAFEGRKKMDIALDGIRAMREQVGTLIIIPNQNLMTLANEKTTTREAFLLADQVLYNGVAGITDIIVRPGHINLDLADLRGVMAEMGRAVLGTGEADGKDRAMVAAERAVQNPLLENTSIAGAKQLLINISGGEDITLFETEKAIAYITSAAGDNCNIHIGSSTDPSLMGKVRVSLVATGIKGEGDSLGSQLLKPFQTNKNADYLESIKHSRLNPLHQAGEDGFGHDSDRGQERDSGLHAPSNPFGGSLASPLPEPVARAGVRAMDPALAGAAGREVGGGRPVFDNPFANGQMGGQMGGQMQADAIYEEDSNARVGMAEERPASTSTNELADQIDNFDHFAKKFDHDGAGDEEPTAKVASARGRVRGSAVDSAWDETGDEVGDEYGEANRPMSQELSRGLQYQPVPKKKGGFLKKLAVAFFGEKTTSTGADEWQGAHSAYSVGGEAGQLSPSALFDSNLDGADGFSADDNDVIDQRGPEARMDDGGRDSAPLLRRRVARRKNGADETADSPLDLFSMPKVE